MTPACEYCFAFQLMWCEAFEIMLNIETTRVHLPVGVEIDEYNFVIGWRKDNYRYRVNTGANWINTVVNSCKSV